MDEIIETTKLFGFDPHGEPTVRRMASGALWLVIELMPPSWADGEPISGGRWDDFAEQLTRVLGVPVHWEDREFFLIKTPPDHAIEMIRTFLHDVRRRYETAEPSSNEEELRAAMAAFGDAWRDEKGRRELDLLDGPARPNLVEIEGLLGAPLPAPVRVVLEMFDGTFRPVSPERPDQVMSSAAIGYALQEDGQRRDVVPIIECGFDPETIRPRLLGVALADPWGPLKHGDGTTTLIGWFEQVTAENATYVWPAPKRITPNTEWTRRDQISDEDLRAMLVAAAVAVHRPDAKRNRIALELFIQLEPQIWVRGIHRKRDGSPSFDEMCIAASEDIERKILRARSQWVHPLTQIASSPRYEIFVGTVEIR